MGARNTEQIFATASLEDDLQNSNAGTPLFAL
jgi:hypothetical protein